MLTSPTGAIYRLRRGFCRIALASACVRDELFVDESSGNIPTRYSNAIRQGVIAPTLTASRKLNLRESKFSSSPARPSPWPSLQPVKLPQRPTLNDRLDQQYQPDAGSTSTSSCMDGYMDNAAKCNLVFLRIRIKFVPSLSVPGTCRLGIAL